MTALTHASALDAGLDAMNVLASASTDDATPLVLAKCRGLLRGYHARWCDVPWKVLAVEQTLEADLVNVDTGKASRTFRLAGKLDAIIEVAGQRVLVDRKTTSHDIEDPAAAYWRQLAVEGQVSHYHLLGWLNGQKFAYAIWDVVRKPGIEPKKLTKAERASIVAERRYCGAAVSDASLAAMQTDERETLELYEHRLAFDCTTARPERYFQRRSVPRLDDDILEYARELWAIAQDLLATRRHSRDYRNSGACFNYGSPCQFLGVCSNYDTFDSDHWLQRASVHPELPGLAGDSRNVLTNSRLRAYQTCKRLHTNRYEIGWERVDETTKESLWFGTLFHAGAEAWTLNLQENHE